MEAKILNGPYTQELVDAIHLPAALAIIKIPRYSKLDFPEAKRNHLVHISRKNAVLKETNKNQTSGMIQRDISPMVT